MIVLACAAGCAALGWFQWNQTLGGDGDFGRGIAWFAMISAVVLAVLGVVT